MQDLGTLGGNYSSASALSRDGRVIVGSSSNADSTNPLVFRWTADGGMESIGTLSGNGVHARAVSNDGNAITGEGHTASNEFHAYRWTADGGMQDLGTLGGAYSTGEDISGDGSVVVGQSSNADNQYRAFRWTEDGGMQDMGTLGGNSASATSVSEDGSTIVGYSTDANNQTRAFIYRTQMQDFTNMIGSFGLLANDVSVAMEYQRETASWLIQRNCAFRDDQRFCLGADGMMNFASANISPRIGPRRDAAAKISAGARLSSAVTIGTGVSIVDYRDEIGAITPDTGYAYGAWLSYAPRGASLLGLKARAGVSLADQKNVVERGIGLDNVEVTEGRTTIQSSVVRGELGYGLSAGNGAVVTPVAAVTWQSSKMKGFEEAAGDFPAIFAGQSFDTVYATTGVELSMPATAKGRFTLAGKVDFDLSSDAIAVAGTSTIPNLEQFAISAGVERQDVRAKVEAGYAQQVGPGVVSVNAQIATPTYGGHARFGLGLGFHVGF